MKTKLFFTLLVSGLIFTQIASARGPQQPHGMKERLQARLDLSEAQLDNIEAIHLKASKSTLPIVSKIKVKKAELDQLMITEKINRNQIIKKVEEISELTSELMVMRTLKRLDVRDVLTEDQRIKFDQMHLKRQRPHRQCNMRTGMMRQRGQRPGCMTGQLRPFFDIEEDIEIEKED